MVRFALQAQGKKKGSKDSELVKADQFRAASGSPKKAALSAQHDRWIEAFTALLVDVLMIGC